MQTEAVQDRIIGGKYRLVSPLGTGAMGVVYRAEQLDVEGHVLREVALKTMRPELSRNPDFSRRFLREVRVAARLQNPHAVTVYDSGLDETTGQLYYTMEYVCGSTLQEILQRQGPLPAGRVVRIIAQRHRGSKRPSPASRPGSRKGSSRKRAGPVSFWQHVTAPPIQRGSC